MKITSAKTQIDTIKKPIDTIHYTYDTTKTLCTYMVNLANGESPTAYLTRIRQYRLDFVQPTPDELKKDSVVLKKQNVLIDVFYYMSVVVNDPIKKGIPVKQHFEYIPMPKEMVIKDYNGNLDYVLEILKKRMIPISEDSILKKIPKLKQKNK